MQEILDLQELKYPTGKWVCPNKIDDVELSKWIGTISNFALKLTDLTKDLSLDVLNWRYRPDGWTIKQVIHHCADSHMNSFIRFKLTLTENVPTIKPYEEANWAELPDTLNADIHDSLNILISLHKRWTVLLKNLSNDDLQKEYLHPETNRKFTLAQCTSLYSWHCEHHLAHIEQALKYGGKFNS